MRVVNDTAWMSISKRPFSNTVAFSHEGRASAHFLETARSVAYGKALADVFRLLEFIDHGDRLVLDRNSAVALLIG